MTQPCQQISSPCIDVCRLDRQSGLCIGCFRTVDEIRRWSTMNEETRLAIMALLSQRKQTIITSSLGKPD